jgi:hypothetical protein
MEFVKKEIKTFFEDHHGQKIDMTDLIEVFDYPIMAIMEACEKLAMEGKIAEID